MLIFVNNSKKANKETSLCASFISSSGFRQVRAPFQGKPEEK